MKTSISNAQVKSSKARKEFTLIQPKFDSKLCDLILDLERRRSAQPLFGTTSPFLFNELKQIFFVLESISSARIEGNGTTVAEFIDSTLNESTIRRTERFCEIQNLIDALQFIEESVRDVPISQAFIRELHKIAVKDLSVGVGEGDITPGEYRKVNVRINMSNHTPPDSGDVPALMNELVDWLDQDVPPRYDLLKIAQSHWRFVWIHPFSNGNGRTARLLTYALLAKLGFTRDGTLLLNPNGIFCSQRNEYYRLLGNADDGSSEALEKWSEFFLEGLKKEVDRVERLTDKRFVEKEILLPAFKQAEERGILNVRERQILELALKIESIQLKDVVELDGKSTKTASRALDSLKSRNLLLPTTPNGRKYRFSIVPILYRFIVQRFRDLELTELELDEPPKF